MFPPFFHRLLKFPGVSLEQVAREFGDATSNDDMMMGEREAVKLQKLMTVWIEGKCVDGFGTRGVFTQTGKKKSFMKTHFGIRNFFFLFVFGVLAELRGREGACQEG